MNYGSSDRVLSSRLIFFVSVLFTFTAYFTFDYVWGVNVPSRYLLVVIGLQFVSLLLGSSKLLTQLGAALMSALIAVAAGIVAVLLLFPPDQKLLPAASIGGGSILLFIILPFLTASRSDPVADNVSEPLFFDDVEDIQDGELIKYGEIKDPGDDQSGNGFTLESEQGSTDTEVTMADDEMEESLIGTERVYELDELSEEKFNLVLGEDKENRLKDKSSLNDADFTASLDKTDFPTVGNDWPGPDAGEEGGEIAAQPNDWVDNAARFMAYEEFDDKPVSPVEVLEGWTKTFNEEKAVPEGLQALRLRTRYKVLDALSGEHFGTYYSDEGYSTLDPDSLTMLLGAKVPAGDLRITKLDWSNFHEVEVHITVRQIEAQGDDGEKSDFTDETEPPYRNGDEEETRAGQVGEDSSPADINEPGSAVERSVPPNSHSSQRWVIYDRKTMQLIGEYVPEGDRPRIDRLTLYRMFPDYHFKTFGIDSIRWEEDEIRIFIKGEKKGSPGSDPGQDRRRNVRDPVK